MTAPFKLLCLVVAVVLFALGAGVPLFYAAGTPRFGFMSAGLFFYALKDLFP